MHPTAKSVRPEPRSGIALVVVLGFLTVLILMAVAFSVIMRTERMASRAYADVVRAKQITQAGLARAMQRIENEVGDDVYPRTNAWVSGVSVTPNPLYGLATTLAARRFLPLATWGTNRISTANYEYIEDPITGTNIGRYAYMIVDCSGLLDANHVGGLARTSGISAAEIPLDINILTELTAYGTNELPARRASTWKRFESLPDLLAVCQSNAVMPANIISANNYRPALFLENTSNLFIYSRAPRGFKLGNAVTNPVYVGGTNWSVAEVAQAFTQMGLGSDDAQAATLALRDYVDANFVPQNPTSICVEATPLINEVVIQQTMPTTNQVVCVPTVEIWFPFARPYTITNTFNYSLVLGIIYSNAVPAVFNPRNTGALDSGRYSATYTFTAPSGGWSQGVYRITAGLPQAIGSSTNETPSSLDGLQAIVVAELREVGSGLTVDRVRFTNYFPSLVINSGVGPPPPAVTIGAAVNDPRLNHLASQWKYVGAAVGSVGATTLNDYNTGIADPASGDGVEATNLYVANRALLSSGEMGMIMGNDNDAWQTIRLLGPNALPVLDWFTVTTNPVYYGRVNLNSTQVPVLQSVLLGARASIWPGQVSASTVTVVQASAIAGELYSNGPYDNVGDLRNHFASGNFTGFGRLQSEGILRNSADLFTTRQQIYTIIVQGESLDRSGNTAAIGKCAAVVWRDPYPGPASTHENFIRFFKWLGELE